MRYQDLMTALVRLGEDPQVHPNTEVALAYENEIHYAHCGDLHEVEREREVAPITSIVFEGGQLVLSTQNEPRAIAR